MPTYTFVILASTDGNPTDLELSDVCLHIADCLDSPVIEQVDGSYAPADFGFASWAIELYEESGDRVWLYTLNATDPRLADLSPQPDETPRTGLRRGWLRRLLGRP